MSDITDRNARIWLVELDQPVGLLPFQISWSPRALWPNLRDGRASVKDPLTSNEPFDSIHGNGSHHVLTKVLSHLEHQIELSRSSRALRIGSNPSSNLTSTTAPITWQTLPTASFPVKSSVIFPLTYGVAGVGGAVAAAADDVE
ncbi:hypothetical protein DVH24_023533 [Malus domestica]|uniref:Uncharacterized protein n=1 Tax=Malus domestica TaxID=3750 RepID=A0A498I2Y3_MALDO|nr:hypothetical protein DVH24_023533 [Malus domestica]